MKKFLFFILLATIFCGTVLSEGVTPSIYAASHGLSVMDQDQMRQTFGTSDEDTTNYSFSIIAISGTGSGINPAFAWYDGEKTYYAMDMLSMFGQSTSGIDIVQLFSSMCKEFQFDAYGYEKDGTMTLYTQNREALFELAATGQAIKAVGTLDELIHAIQADAQAAPESTTPTDSTESTAEPTTAADGQTTNNSLENFILIDAEGVKCYLTGKYTTYGYQSDDYFMIELEAVIENNSTKTVSATIDSGSVNGWEVHGTGIIDTRPGKKQKSTFTLYLNGTDVHSINEIEEIEITLQMYDENYSTFWTSNPIVIPKLK